MAPDLSALPLSLSHSESILSHHLKPEVEVFWESWVLRELSCTCHWHVNKMLAKHPNVKDSQKLVLYHNILSETDTKFAHWTCVRWRTKDSPTLTKVSKLPKNLSEVYFHSFVKNKNWYFLFFFLVNCILLYIYLIYFTSSFNEVNDILQIIDSIFGLLPKIFTTCHQLVMCCMLCQPVTHCRKL